MKTDINALSGLEMANAFRKRQLSPVEVAKAAIRTAELAAERFNAIASSDPEGALKAAEASEARWKADAPLSRLDGVPITFKDSFHVKGLPRWHGTACNPGTASRVDAAPVMRVREAGMIVVAKTTMPDFALLMSGLSSRHGVIRNAWDPETNPGGSSSGAGTAVAAGVAPIAVGTDMIGSVRIPAALAGLASIKPTQGRIAYDPPGNYRSAGPMAKTIDDVDAALTVLGREAASDFFSLEGQYTTDGAAFSDLSGRRIAVLRKVGFGDPVDAATVEAIDRQAEEMVRLGATLVDLDDLDASEADYHAIYWTVLYKAAPEYFAMDAERRGRIQAFVGGMLDEILPQSALFAAEATKRMAAASIRISQQLDPFDYVLSPALPVRAFSALDVSPTGASGVSHMGFACWFNQIGWPSATVPVLESKDGCPVTVQISGKRFDDAGVLQVARLLERCRDFTIAFPTVRERHP